MDESQRAELAAIGHDADGLMEEVEEALDEHTAHAERLAVRVRVEEMAARFRAFVGALGEKDRFEAERRVGRKVLDVQKQANALPAPPKGREAAPRASTDFFETREGKSSRQPVKPGEGAALNRPRFQVTGDVEAWCGPCAELRTHTIVAMVGDQPAQVVCQICNSRHKYRTEPARGKKDGAVASRPRSSTAPPPGQAKMDEKNNFINELRLATNVRPFQPRERYKAGEIIEHPELGRGKIENVLPNSLLVRFSNGLRPVKLA
jgi:hypothetical protein